MDNITEQQKNDLSYRQGVGLMIINAANKIFIGQRIDSAVVGGWQMPQGGIDAGEEPRQTAIREMKEEIGTSQGEIIGETQGWYNYDFPSAIMCKLWHGKYRGQQQKWFLIRFTGEDKDINITYDVNPEFINWKWAEEEEVINSITPFKKQLYKDIFAELRQLIK